MDFSLLFNTIEQNKLRFHIKLTLVPRSYDITIIKFISHLKLNDNFW